jgi:hypothetical protein
VMAAGRLLGREAERGVPGPAGVRREGRGEVGDPVQDLDAGAD